MTQPQPDQQGAVVVLKQHRKRLPPRHVSQNIKFRSQILGGRALHLQPGYYTTPDEALANPEKQYERLGELFVAGPLSGSAADSQRKEFATLLSIALQYGMPLKEIAENMQRDPQGRPLTVFGEIVDELMKEQG